jgi:hypothetical protein
MNCLGCNDNVYKQQFPNYEAGIRRWVGKENTPYVATGLNQEYPNFVVSDSPAERMTNPNVKPNCIYKVDVPLYNWRPENEPYANVKSFGLLPYNLWNLIVLVVFLYLLWYFLKDKVDFKF